MRAGSRVGGEGEGRVKGVSAFRAVRNPKREGKKMTSRVRDMPRGSLTSFGALVAMLTLLCASGTNGELYPPRHTHTRMDRVATRRNFTCWKSSSTFFFLLFFLPHRRVREGGLSSFGPLARHRPTLEHDFFSFVLPPVPARDAWLSYVREGRRGEGTAAKAWTSLIGAHTPSIIDPYAREPL